MGFTSSNTGRQRLTPIAACLATAFAIASGTAAGSPTHAPHATAAALHRLSNGELPAPPSWWKTPDPDEITLRSQPFPHAIPAVPANSVVVHNCNDSGNGSLRAALTNANNGDTIDLTQLTCSTITLTTGSILFTQTTITLQGPGSKYLAVSGNDVYAPLLHDGLGTLYINDLTVEHGSKYFTDAQIDDARGGCIFSGGGVFLSGAVVDHCQANDTSSTHRTEGGAIYAYTGVTVSNSAVLNSSALGHNASGGGIFTPGFLDVTDSFISGNYARLNGGGAYVLGQMTVKYSTIEGNRASGGGGLYVIGSGSVTNSTIANNAGGVGGGLVLNGTNEPANVTLLSSTVSGNVSSEVGGVWIGGRTSARVGNSTIAFNYESSPTKYGAGLYLYGPVEIESTIVSNNTYSGGSAPDDMGGNGTAVFAGANNLVGYSSVTPPTGTIELQSAMLGPLANNGGSTQTHMLLSGSPAIDAGNDVANVAFDQRGDGYPRSIGNGTDIGAYELDTNDVIFVNGFDP